MFRQKITGRLITLLAMLCASSMVQAQAVKPVERIEPLHWYVDMAEPVLQLLVYGKNIGQATLTLTDYPGVKIKQQQTVANPNYLFVDLEIAPGTHPGLLKLNFSLQKKKVQYRYELKARRFPDNRVNGFHQGDLLYLIMPDRFANGNPQNDSMPGMRENKIDRKTDNRRHGGDLAGIRRNLPYVKDLGITTLWLNPVQENNQPHESYHGYAVTDWYKVDPRFGTNAEYVALVEEAHQKGLKVIMDLVHNHVGDQHWFIRDLPMADWVNQWPSFTRTTYRAITHVDPYADAADQKIMRDGWFDNHMPDLNQRNPLLAKYLIQNNIWWVEYAGLNGFRLDTYAYPDEDFMRDCVGAIRKQYPDIGVVGEVWVQTVAESAYWAEGNRLHAEPATNLPGVTDFPLYDAVRDGLNEPFGWNTGLRRIYYTLAQDGLYGDASKNVIFLDNHDISRAWAVFKQDMAHMKMAHVMLLTMRGIPQLYYGSELLFGNYANGGGTNVRQDMPGGWQGDSTNVFTATGRSQQQNELFDYISRLARWRQGSDAIRFGKLTQFVPEDNVYVYFRHTENSSVMVVVNADKTDKTLDAKRFASRLNGFKGAMDVVSGQYTVDLNKLRIPAKTALVLDLQK